MRPITQLFEALVDEDGDKPTIVDTDDHVQALHELWSVTQEVVALLEPLPAGRVAVVADRYSIVLPALIAAWMTNRTIGLVSPLLPSGLMYQALSDFAPSTVAEDVGGARVRDWKISHGAGLAAANSLPDPHTVLFTSGTTAAPKMVAHTPSTLLASYRLVRAIRFELLAPEMLAQVGDPSSTQSESWYGSRAAAGFPMRYLSALPVASIGGVTLGLQAILGGEQIVDRPRYEPVAIMEAIRSFSITSLAAGPTTAQGMLRVARRGSFGHDWPLMVFGLGSSTVPQGLCADIEATFGCRTVTGYGATELGGVVATTRFTGTDRDRWSSLGRPVPGVAIRCDDTECLVQSPALAVGYLNPDGTIAPLRKSNGWYATGDVLSCDADGIFHFEGRRSGLIVRACKKINPEAIEAVIEGHPNVTKAGVVGVPSRIAGEEDVLALVISDLPVVAAELRRLCSDKLGNTWSPRFVRTVDTLPLSADGKIDRVALRHLAMGP
ncbi:MAG: class I adenylate-forming enzyme family protein [Acidimicrobiales bacterium]